MKPDLELLTILEVCSKLNFSRKTIYKMIHSGELKAINVGTGKRTHFRVPMVEVKRWIDQKLYLANPSLKFVAIDQRISR